MEERRSPYIKLGLSPSPQSNSLGGVVLLGLANLGGRGARLEAALERGVAGGASSSLALVRPLHALPRGSGVTAFLRSTTSHLHHLHSGVRRVGPGVSLAVCPGPSTTLVTEASCSWLTTTPCFHLPPGAPPCLAKWDPGLESAGHHLRVGLRSVAALDTRDCALMPTTGALLSLEHTLSLGHDSAAHKVGCTHPWLQDRF